MSTPTLKSYCRLCNHETYHTILSEHKESFRDEYTCDISYQIVSCLGCGTKSFREIFEDIESNYQISETEWEIPTTIDIYPKYIKGHRSLDTNFFLPEVVGRIYKEVLLAFKEEALILSGLGLRGVVEAVCNDLDVKGRNLEDRITKLANAGYISKKDAERLHGIRFMGNDAAHEIKKPKKEQLDVALKIVEHLLSSVYILEKEAEGKIDTAITDFSRFESLLAKKIKLLNAGEELPLVAILGQDIRRIKESAALFESELCLKIDSSHIGYISKGKIAKFQGSKNDLQHFIITGT